jgi:hypothetical protein
VKRGLRCFTCNRASDLLIVGEDNELHCKSCTKGENRDRVALSNGIAKRNATKKKDD